jgi:hypothetical protein
MPTSGVSWNRPPLLKIFYVLYGSLHSAKSLATCWGQHTGYCCHGRAWSFRSSCSASAEVGYMARMWCSLVIDQTRQSTTLSSSYPRISFTQQTKISLCCCFCSMAVLIVHSLCDGIVWQNLFILQQNYIAQSDPDPLSISFQLVFSSL